MLALSGRRARVPKNKFQRSRPSMCGRASSKCWPKNVDGRFVYTDDPLFGCCRNGGAFELPSPLPPLDGVSPDSLFWRSWYSWKQGTMHRLVWHSGQWYLVLRRKIRPWSSMVFQQKLQPRAGPVRMTGQCCERLSIESSRIGCNQGRSLNVCFA